MHFSSNFELTGGAPETVQLPSHFKKQALAYKLSDSVMSGSHFIFDKFEFSKEWLKRPVEEWNTRPDYMEMADFFQNLLVTNDTAERGVKFISDYAMCLTKDSQDRQNILQVVEQERRQISNVTKENLIKATKASQ